jgi:hypothetical protein
MQREVEELFHLCVKKLNGKQLLANRLGVSFDDIWAWENFEGEPTNEQITQMQEIADEP